MIVITGGGTGGHLAIARALASELAKRGEKLIFIGSQNGQDRQWFEHLGLFYKTLFLPTSAVVNKGFAGKILALFKILKLSFWLRKTLLKNGVRAVISVGGYSAAPASFAALLCHIPLFIHEQNAVAGRLNQLLRPFATGFFSSYAPPFYSYPVGEKFFKLARDRSELKMILFLGGSQGAKAINSLALALAPKLKERGIAIMHQCGSGNFNELSLKYKELKVQAELFEFSPDMPSLMASADMAISRAGASTLWELVANRLPSIFIPYPYAAANHQHLNAAALAQKGLAKICPQKSEAALAKDVLAAIDSIDIKEISLKLKECISPNGSTKIVGEILKRIK